MDELRCFRTFLEVAKRGSFQEAATQLRTSPANVSKQIAWLEDQFGARLLNRSSKKISFTSAGQAMLNEGAPILGSYDRLKSSVLQPQCTASGVVRVEVPPSFATRAFLPAIAAFQTLHPQIQVVLSLWGHQERPQGMIDSVDITIKVAQSLRDSSLIAMKLGQTDSLLVASPAYLERCSPVSTPADLANCNCLVNIIKTPSGVWHFTKQEEEFSVRVSGTIWSDMGEVLKQAAVMGMGISMNPRYMISEELADGRLVVVLPDYEQPKLNVYAMYASAENMPARVRAFLDFLALWTRYPNFWANTTSPAVNAHTQIDAP